MALVNVRVWINKSNTFKLYLTSKEHGELEQAAQLDLVDSMELELRDTEGTITSIVALANEANAPINWWHEDLVDGQVLFDLGPWAETNIFPAGVYEARLMLSSETVNNGLGTVWLSWINNDLSITFIE
ncbi:MAG: hypothetical protein ACR2PH_11750 [Desulfobulbia bacterium]